MINNLLLRRRLMMAGDKEGPVPGEYTQLSYVEGTGSQYIAVTVPGLSYVTPENLGIYARVYQSIDLDSIIRQGLYQDYRRNVLFGNDSYKGSSTASGITTTSESYPYYFVFRKHLTFATIQIGYSGNYVLRCGDYCLEYDNNISPMGIGEYEIRYDPYKSMFDIRKKDGDDWMWTGHLYAGYTYDEETDGYLIPRSLIVGGGLCYSGGTGGNPQTYVTGFVGKIYDFKIYFKGRLVRHLTPVRRNSDNVCGMYDRVQGEFYTSASSTAYTGGI